MLWRLAGGVSEVLVNMALTGEDIKHTSFTRFQASDNLSPLFQRTICVLGHGGDFTHTVTPTPVNVFPN